MTGSRSPKSSPQRQGATTLITLNSRSLTLFGRRKSAEAMDAKGVAFLGAALLLERKGGHEFVVLYLLCQGIEVVLKSVLQLKDYGRYTPELKRLGHRLDRLAERAVTEFNLKPLSKALADELRTLTTLYCGHLLRYGSAYDFLRGPAPVPCDRVWRRTAAVLRLAEREMRRTRDAGLERS